LIGERLFDLIGETALEKKLMQLAFLDRLDQTYDIISFEHQVALPNGEVSWQEWDHRALFDRNGDFFQFQSVGRDITDLKLAEKALKQREAQLCLVTDALPVLLTYINATQQVIYVNRRNQEYWPDKPWADMLGEYLWDILGPTAYQQVRVQVEAALSGDRVNFEQKVTLPNQKSFWINVTFVSDQSGDDHVNGFFALIKRLDLGVQEVSRTSSSR
jgi:PAS domain-containing protein